MESAFEKRTTHRIEIEVPVQLEQGFGMTRDVSLTGIYFTTDQNLAEGTRIRFTMDLEYAIPGRSMHLDCQAHILRVESQGDQLGVAARIEDFTYLPRQREHDAGVISGSNRLQ